MSWVLWRQHRWLLLIGGALVAAVAAALLASGSHVAAVITAFSPPRCQDSTCPERLEAALGTLRLVRMALVPVMLVLPALVGLFVGAPLLARELEHGTHQVAWTQSVTWRRWLLVKLGVLGVAVTGASLLVGLLVEWWQRPFLLSGQDVVWSWYEAMGWVPAGYTLFAFALGVAAGTLTRKTLPAMVTTLVVFVAARLGGQVLRPRFRPPLDRAAEGPGPSAVGAETSFNELYVQSFYQDPQGRRLPGEDLFAQFPPGATDAEAFEAFFRQHGWVQHVLFHPAERFWLFQGIEAALFGLLALLLLAVTVWSVERRAR